MKTWEQYEADVERVIQILSRSQPDTTIERNVKLDGPDGLRQIDILMRGVMGPFELTTIIDCKHYSKRVNVTTVDAFHSVMRDVRANNGAIVSRKGFTGSALRKASRLGINLLRADKLSAAKDLGLNIPICITELSPRKIHVTGRLSTSFNTVFNRQTVFADLVQDSGALERLSQQLIADGGLTRHEPGVHSWTPPSDLGPLGLKDERGLRHPVEDVVFNYEVASTRYFGQLDDLEIVWVLHDQAANYTNLIISQDDLGLDYRRMLSPLADGDPLPVEPVLRFNVGIVPRADAPIDLNSVRFGLG